MRDMVKMGLILLLITAISGLILGVTNSMTEGIILERALESDRASLEVLLEDADGFEPVESAEIDSVDIVTDVFVGTQGETVVGYAVKVAPNGYGGEVEMMVGINTNDEITGVVILSQSETPGLGTKITEPDYTDRFIGLSAEGDVSVDAIAGATVSSTAAVNGVNTAIALYQDTLKN